VGDKIDVSRVFLARYEAAVDPLSLDLNDALDRVAENGPPLEQRPARG